MSGILTTRRALYFATAVLLYGTLGVTAALLHKFRIHGAIYRSTYLRQRGLLPGDRRHTWIRYHAGPVIAMLVWTFVSSLYLIGFYFAPVSPSLRWETAALVALLIQGVVSMVWLSSYSNAFWRPNSFGYFLSAEWRDLYTATFVLGWVTITALAATLYVYGRTQRRTHKSEDVWPRRLVDLVEGSDTPASPVDEYARLIPAREREPESASPSAVAAILSPNALRILAYVVIGLTAAATVGLDATLVHWFMKDNGFDYTPYRRRNRPLRNVDDCLLPEGCPNISNKKYPHEFKPGGPIVVLVFVCITTFFTLCRPLFTFSIGQEAWATGILTVLGITTMSVLSTYWPVFNPYHPAPFKAVGVATLVLGWIAACTLLFLLVLELLVVLRSVRDGVEGVSSVKFVDLVSGKSLWWVYVPEEHPSWSAQLDSVAAEREAEESEAQAQ